MNEIEQSFTVDAMTVYMSTNKETQLSELSCDKKRMSKETFLDVFRAYSCIGIYGKLAAKAILMLLIF